MPEICLYQYEISPFADKVRRVLTLKGLDYSVDEVLISKIKKYKSVSPTSKFPAMKYDGHMIVDSTDIIRFIEEKHSTPSLIPEGPKDRALAHILEDWADESLYFYDLAIRGKEHNVDLLTKDIAKYETGFSKKLIMMMVPKATNKIAHVQGLGRKETSVIDAEIQHHFSALEDMLEPGGWLCGTNISIADIAIASMIHVLIRAMEPAQALPNYPKLRDWKSRIDDATKPVIPAPVLA